MRQEYLRAAAEAYANLSDIQSDCYHYLNDGFDSSIQARLSSIYTTKLSAKSAPKKHISNVVATALAELQYPVNQTTGYAWTGNERAAFANIPKATWSRNNLSDYVNFILDDINANSRAAWSAIQLQVVGQKMNA